MRTVQSATPTRRMPALTPKELKIIDLICKEYTSEEIGQKMRLDKRTIEGYRLIIMRKIKAKTAIGLLKYAVRHGLYRI